MISPNFFNVIFVIPILNLLMLFYKGILSLQIPGAFGWAIIALTVFVRLILHPLFKKQMEATQKMADLKPHIDRLSKQHKKDPKRFQQEQAKLFSEAGINPAAGCLFILIQFPIFIGLYNTLSVFFINGGFQKAVKSINEVLYSPYLRVSTIDLNFFGFNLAISPQQGKGIYFIIPILTALLQYLQVKYSTPPTPPAKEITKKGDKPDMASDFQRTFSTQMKFIFPLMIGFFSYQFPVGLSLYWNVFSIFSIIQYVRHKPVQPVLA